MIRSRHSPEDSASLVALVPTNVSDKAAKVATSKTTERRAPSFLSGVAAIIAAFQLVCRDLSRSAEGKAIEATIFSNRGAATSSRALVL